MRVDRAALPVDTERQPFELDRQTMAWKELQLFKKSQRRQLRGLYLVWIVQEVLPPFYTGLTRLKRKLDTCTFNITQIQTQPTKVMTLLTNNT